MIDVIILAAGKGSRLAGVMPPYFKPLMTVNGRSVIVSMAKMVQSVLFEHDYYRLTIVTAPENTLPIVQLLNDADVDARIVVQRKADGPAAAVEMGLQDAERTLVLMGDNIMPEKSLKRLMLPRESNATVVGGTRVTYADDSIESFTRFRTGTKEWVEKVPVTTDDNECFVWLGPLSFPTEALKDVLKRSAGDVDARGERPIGPLLGEFKNITRVEVECTDIGVVQS